MFLTHQFSLCLSLSLALSLKINGKNILVRINNNNNFLEGRKGEREGGRKKRMFDGPQSKDVGEVKQIVSSAAALLHPSLLSVPFPCQPAQGAGGRFSGLILLVL